ncbi:MAG: glycoside hydrolase family 3 N-terminal domain-containing protein [Flavobacteriales bacterium]|nr:glycoside hydrolase family 3 N-terminal domain-containing protein [Flavobacteriales bacterium]
MKFLSAIIGVILLLFTSFLNEESTDVTPISAPIYQADTLWVDSVLTSLTQEQKIAQLFMVAAYSNKGEKHQKEIEFLIENYHIGGLMFLQGGPVRQLRLTNHYQSLSQVPLMISQDAEWGVSMRIDSTIRFPWQMTLGAIQYDSLIYQMGRQIGKDCKRLGVHVNFAPVVDVNSNPNNPIINNRSFGEDPQRVAQLSLAYMQGLQDEGVLACAKHFPGHGDTDSDSHKTLPTINHSKERLDSMELIPFKYLFDKGLGSVMVAHLNIPSLDDTDSLASTLSKKVVTDLLKEELAFDGLVFTDALNMKGVSNFYEPGEVDLKALLAGNDVLLFAQDVPKAIIKIKEAIEKNIISQEYVDERCRKILMAKQWFGLDESIHLNEGNLVEDLNSKESRRLNQDLIEKSLTVLQNTDDLLPLGHLDTLNLAVVCIGENSKPFEEMVAQYAPLKIYHISEEHSEEERNTLLRELQKYNLVIASVHKSNKNAWKSYHIHKNTDLFLQTLALQSKVILNVFANPYSISDLLMTYSFDGLILGYQNSKIAQESVAQLIFGGIGANGKLPVSNTHFKVGDGLNLTANRIRYTSPENLGISPKILLQVDSIAQDAIEKEATPGCQILAIKNGAVFYQKSFGYHTYKKKQKVKNTDVYDLASLTKIIASVPSLMYLEENKTIDLDKTLSNYIELADTSDKKNLKIREILAHQSGLAAWIPFYIETLEEDGSLRDTLYSTEYSDTFSVRVADNIYLHREYPDSIMERILVSELKEKEYKYSDMGFYIFKEIIEQKTNMPLEAFVQNTFYEPLGLSTMGYLPAERIDSTRIVPTEFDYYFRSQLLKGDVHDMGAAMLGGVSGHAGLFSNANDLGVFMQMLLQGGQYADKRYFEAKTVNKFTDCQYCKLENRRGAGFDKAVLEGQEGGPACDCSPSSTAFGHSGFTGTLVWADPEEQLVYVFLSNRIHPTSENKKLLKMDVRTKIMEVFYDAIRTTE